jgi:hypothetical protein
MNIDFKKCTSQYIEVKKALFDKVNQATPKMFRGIRNHFTSES